MRKTVLLCVLLLCCSLLLAPHARMDEGKGTVFVVATSLSGVHCNPNQRALWIIKSGGSAGVYRCSAVDTFTQVGTATAPGGSNGQIQYNNSGAFGGLSTTGTGNVVRANSPALVTPTGIVKGDVGLGNVANVDTTNAANITSGLLATARGGFGTDMSAANGVSLWAAGVPTLTSTTGTGNFARVSGTALTGSSTVNGNSFTTGTYTLTGGAGKTFTFNNTLAISGTDGSTLNIGTGGTLGSNAFNSNAYPLVYTANGTLTAGAHIVTGGIVLSAGTGTLTFSGSAAFTSSATYQCTYSNNSNANAARIAKDSGTQITATGTGTDVIVVICVGN